MSNPIPNLAAFIPSPGASLILQERPIPSPGPGELLIRNLALAINPMDWKRQSFNFAIPSYPAIIGTDIAGVVVAVGPDVTTFKPGDRVLAAAPEFVTQNPDHSGFQTYTTVLAGVAAKIPENVSLAEAATLPVAVATATIAVFDVLGLPVPSSSAEGSKPATASGTATNAGILVWGGASSAGSAIIQFARLAGLTVYATASPQHHAWLQGLGAKAVVDYRSPTAVEELLAAAREVGTPITLAVDAIATEETLALVGQVLERSAEVEGQAKTLAHLLPWPDALAKPEGVRTEFVAGGRIWKERLDFGRLVFNELLGKWLEGGKVVPSKVQVVEGGLGGLQAGIDLVKKGVSGVKVVVELKEYLN
ncbi:hypothetical protein VTJ04DRAFT_3999 [Mycothermus thermophilus]|uniref:uncharacterized protein n=1 Tax=Humicola insolens TaxID=85995 RepID=UPI003743706C